MLMFKATLSAWTSPIPRYQAALMPSDSLFSKSKGQHLFQVCSVDRLQPVKNSPLDSRSEAISEHGSLAVKLSKCHVAGERLWR